MSMTAKCDQNCVHREAKQIIELCSLERHQGPILDAIGTLAFRGSIHEDPQMREDYLRRIRELIPSLHLTKEERMQMDRFINHVAISAMNCCTGVTVNTLIR